MYLFTYNRQRYPRTCRHTFPTDTPAVWSYTLPKKVVYMIESIYLYIIAQ